MKILTFILSLQVLSTVYAAETKQNSNCANIEITYKLENQVHKFKTDVCTNKYSQYFSKNCADGCEFKEALDNNQNLKISTDGMGSPGGQFCKKLGYHIYQVNFEFKGKNVEYLNVCFNKNMDSFVSSMFLSDLAD